mgnify:CR=1 FL=1
MDDKIMLHNRLKEIRVPQKLSRAQLAELSVFPEMQSAQLKQTGIVLLQN